MAVKRLGIPARAKFTTRLSNSRNNKSSSAWSAARAGGQLPRTIVSLNPSGSEIMNARSPHGISFGS